MTEPATTATTPPENQTPPPAPKRKHVRTRPPAPSIAVQHIAGPRLEKPAEAPKPGQAGPAPPPPPGPPPPPSFAPPAEVIEAPPQWDEQTACVLAAAGHNAGGALYFGIVTKEPEMIAAWYREPAAFKDGAPQLAHWLDRIGLPPGGAGPVGFAVDTLMAGQGIWGVEASAIYSVQQARKRLAARDQAPDAARPAPPRAAPPPPPPPPSSSPVPLNGAAPAPPAGRRPDEQGFRFADDDLAFMTGLGRQTPNYRVLKASEAA